MTIQMPLPLAVQLYSVRDVIDSDGLRLVLSQLAATGYAGVETLGIPGGDPVAARDLLEELGLQLASAHTWADLREREPWRRAVSAIAQMGARTVITASLSSDDLSTSAALARSADILNAAAVEAARHGLRFGIHTHTSEVVRVDGVRAYATLSEQLDPAIAWQIDVYWAAVAGVDPVTIIDELGSRVVSLHIKDGSARQGDPMVAVGAGSLDITGIVTAAARHPSIDWLIVELDDCETPVMDALQESYDFMTAHATATGP